MVLWGVGATWPTGNTPMRCVAGHLKSLVRNLEIAIRRPWSQHFSSCGPSEPVILILTGYDAKAT